MGSIKLMENKDKISNGARKTDEVSEKDPQLYEISYLLSPLVPAEKLADEVLVLRSVVEKEKALILSEGPAKMRSLAYAINKFDTAYFGWLRLMLRPDLLESVKKELEKNSNIIRFLIIKTKQETFAKKTKLARPQRIISRIKKATLPTAERKIQEKEIDKKLEELLAM